ncbi:MAG: site-specific integrase [Nitrososphaerales archaeon]
MATRRRRSGPGDAKVFRTADGRWCAFVELPTEVDGKRRRKKVSGTTRAQVVEKRDKLRVDLAKGISPPNEKLTVRQVMEAWLVDAEDRVSPATIHNYRYAVENHIAPSALGGRQVAKLTEDDVAAFLREKRKTHSARTVALIRTVLAAAMARAERRGLVVRNVVRDTRGPRLERSTHRAMTAEQVRAFLEAARGHRFEAAFAVMLSLGLRPGECLGLRWSDVDLANRRVTIRHSLKRDGTVGDVKNDGSRRQLSLPAELVPLLETRKALQDTDREIVEEVWHGGDDPLVFSTTFGTPMSDRNMALREFVPVCEKAGIGRWHLHECRHTAATLMLTNGVPIEQVSRVLGHTSIRITSDTYAHLLPRHLEPAVETIGAVLWGAA